MNWTAVRYNAVGFGQAVRGHQYGTNGLHSRGTEGGNTINSNCEGQALPKLSVTTWSGREDLVGRGVDGSVLRLGAMGLVIATARL